METSGIGHREEHLQIRVVSSLGKLPPPKCKLQSQHCVIVSSPIGLQETSFSMSHRKPQRMLLVVNLIFLSTSPAQQRTVPQSSASCRIALTCNQRLKLW